MNHRSCVVIDYGMGNIFSVLNALKAIGVEGILTNNRNIIKNAESIILPGVGAFPNAIRKINNNGINQSILEFLSKERPLLGICLGMQLLMEIGHEFKITNGLGLIKGEVKIIDIKDNNLDKIRIPLIGWHKITQANFGSSSLGDKLSSELLNKSYYFVHSFSVLPKYKSNVLAYVEHDSNKIVAAVCRNNIVGFQFHPEKSGKLGLDLLDTFFSQS